jgi:hypothetical protein
MKYPNLEAIAQGAIAGNFREWPQVRPEAQTLLAERSTLLSALRTARAVLIPAALFGDEATVEALRAVNDALKGTEE